MSELDLVIVGGGQSGLAAAYAARRAGLSFVVLEAADAATGSWPRYYDSLTLFSPARHSELPGRRFGGDPDRYPTRDELADYLRAYAAGFAGQIHTGQRVTRVELGFTVFTEAGLELRAKRLVAATGAFGAPYRPSLPGLDGFAGDVLHAAHYRESSAFANRRVIVVGGGNSAIQIAAELAGVARVSVATRSPLRFAPQRPLGRDLHWWLTRTGIDEAPLGRWLRGHTTPVLDDGRYRAALATGNPDSRALFERLDGHDVVWRDGDRERVDVVLLATGYRPDLSYLEPTGALDERGRPLHRAGVSTAVGGLGFVGLEHQRSIASATVRGVGRDARHVVDRLARAAASPHDRPAPVRGRCCALVPR
jgi:putative flavoprotein involved in K+ transport